MDSERSRSPLELPPYTSAKERLQSRTNANADTDAALAPAAALSSMPISFGVFVLGLAVTCLSCLLLSGAAYRNVIAHAQEANRASERRLGDQLLQLEAANAALHAQLELRAQDIDAQRREIERLSTELKALRGRGGLDGRAARARR